MTFFWNDETYWERYRASHKVFVRVFLPLFVVSFLLWWLFLDENIELLNIVLVSMLTGATIFTFISIFLHFPNVGIPDTYPQWGKNLMYIGHFLVAIFCLYIAITKVIFV